MSIAAAIIKAIHAAANFLTSLIAFLNAGRQIRAGEDKAAARSLKEQTIRVQKARAARRAVDAHSLPDDDPHLRD
jgi:hypothetical protein